MSSFNPDSSQEDTSPLQNQRFSQGFSHFWPVALAFMHVHARAGLQMLPK
jgi:hypothetical protein